MYLNQYTLPVICLLIHFVGWIRLFTLSHTISSIIRNILDPCVDNGHICVTTQLKDSMCITSFMLLLSAYVQWQIPQNKVGVDDGDFYDNIGITLGNP